MQFVSEQMYEVRNPGHSSEKAYAELAPTVTARVMYDSIEHAVLPPGASAVLPETLAYHAKSRFPWLELTQVEARYTRTDQAPLSDAERARIQEEAREQAKAEFEAKLATERARMEAEMQAAIAAARGEAPAAEAPAGDAGEADQPASAPAAPTAPGASTASTAPTAPGRRTPPAPPRPPRAPARPAPAG